MRNLISTFCILMLLSIGCREKVIYEIPNFEVKPTVNGIIYPDSLICVHISLASGLENEEIVNVQDAKVILFTDEMPADTLCHVGEGWFRSTTFAKCNKTYKCLIDVNGYEQITCSTYIPKPDTLCCINHNKNAGKDEEGVIYPSVTFTIKDIPAIRQFYEVHIRFLERGNIQFAEIHHISDSVILNEGMSIALFSNEMIKNDEYCMTLNYRTNSTSSWGDEPLKMDLYPLVIELRTVSYDYYQYAKQLFFYKKGRYPEYSMNSFIPVPLYSNIKNGYGIIAGYSAYFSDTIDIN